MTIKEAIARIQDHMETHRILERNGLYIYDALSMAIAALLEKEERDNRGWIPVTEQLPTTDGRFMVTIKSRRGKPHVEMRNFHAGSQTWEHRMGGNQDTVLAWQARPRPYGYKPKEE